MIREAFLAMSSECRDLIASRDVGRRWDEPSALAEMTVGALAGHLARATILVAPYLDAGPPAAGNALASAGQYFARLPLTADVSDELNTSIRQRGAQEAAEGRDALVARLDAAIADLRVRLAAEPVDRCVTAFADTNLLLDEYLVTRIVEMVVHLDDLAVSVGRETPELPAAAMACALGCLLEIARIRNGDLAVVRAMARRERDTVNALRVF